MEVLQEQITNSIRRNTDGVSFVPKNLCNDVISIKLVGNILNSTNIERYRIEELCHAIIAQAKITFAILTLIERPEIILSFFAGDQLQQAPIDHRLPLSLNDLHHLFGDANSAFQFYTNQWQFIAPVFSSSLLPRVFDNDVVLPIVTAEDAGEGGFGVAQLIEIESSHHKFSSPGNALVVRKQLKPSRTARADYELELRNLSILRLIKHPCVIDLLTCFTYKDQHNLIFTYADNGSVEDVLSGKRQSPFQHADELYLALCGVCSAAAAVHDFLAPDLEAIGCHHDIKPSNILISGQRLVLADFGLSRFKEPEQGSESYFRGGRGDYLAPECEDLVYDFKKHQVRRSSDVWSLGCVILEYLVYQTEGATGVADFRLSRTYKMEGLTYHRFHEGPSKVNDEVTSRLLRLQSHDKSHICEAAELLTGVFSLVPRDRPRIANLCHLMRIVLVSLLLTQIEEAFVSVNGYGDELIMEIERKRFSSWTFAIRQANHSPTSASSGILDARNCELFENLVRTLVDLRNVLRTQFEDGTNRVAQNVLPLRKATDMLYQASPSTVRQSALERFELDALHIPRVAEAQASLPRDSDVAQLAMVKTLNDQLQSWAIPDVTTPAFPYSEIDITRMDSFYKVGSYNKSQVLVETKPLHDYHRVGDFRLALSRRMNAVAKLLNAGHSLQVLHCRGCFINEKLEMGLVYAFPDMMEYSPVKSLLQQDASLRDIINKDPRGKARPVLGDRFVSAHALASSVLRFHRLNWIQRGICSQNIVFFRPEGATWKAHMNKPFFLGFLHSREVAVDAFSEGHWKPQMEQGYQHPAYTSSFRGFLPHFDYYSLGIVLIELGLWSPLNIFAATIPEADRSSRQFTSFLLTTVLPGLGQKMGLLYETAVRKCLTWTPAEPPIEGTCSPAENMRFKEEVVDVLSRCRA